MEIFEFLYELTFLRLCEPSCLCPWWPQCAFLFLLQRAKDTKVYKENKPKLSLFLETIEPESAGVTFSSVLPYTISFSTFYFCKDRSDY